MKRRTLEGLRKYQREWHRATAPHYTSVRRAFIDSLKVGGCVDCGNKNLTVLEFDHLSDKAYNLSRMKSHSFASIEREAAKCEVVCSNCHRIRTASRRKVAA